MENEDLAVTEIVADVVEHLEERQDVSQPVVLGPGSTVGAVKRALDPTGKLARDVIFPWEG